MFRPCILAIVRFYYKLNKQLYNMCVGYSGETRSRLTLVKFTVQPDDGQYTGPKHVVVYPMYYSV